VSRLQRFVPVLFACVLATACQSTTPPTPATSIEDARAEFTRLVNDVTLSDAHAYRVLDDRGDWLGPIETVWVPEANLFAGVYFTYSESDKQFHVQLGTSTDLLTWIWRVKLGDRASQPSIEAGAGGHYIVAWEQEPDPIYMVIVDYSSWEDLLGARISRQFDVPITTPACGEGTPSIEAVTADRVDIGFHYHWACTRDLEAAGWTDWKTWHSSLRRDLVQTILDNGVQGHIGDRDIINFRGHDLMVVEGQTVPEDNSSWRLYLYDEETKIATPLNVKTHAGSPSMLNPTVEIVQINGREALLVTTFIYTEGSHGDEDGTLIYYRYLDS